MNTLNPEKNSQLRVLNDLPTLQIRTVELREEGRVLEVTQLSLVPRSRAEPRCLISLTSPDLPRMEEDSTLFIQSLGIDSKKK